MNIGLIPTKIARTSPAREALIDVPNARRISYGALDERVCRLANALLDDLGLVKGDRVAILSKNCIEYLEVYFACARVGLIAQPLNWRLAPAEIERILADGEPRAVMCEAEYLDVVGELKGRIGAEHWLVFGAQESELAASYEALVAGGRADEPAASAAVGDDDPVLILYTGGTTGESKGALHTHKSLYMGMLNQTVAERIVPSDVYMLTGQMFHIPVRWR